MQANTAESESREMRSSITLPAEQEAEGFVVFLFCVVPDE